MSKPMLCMVFPIPFPNKLANSSKGIPVPIPKKRLAESNTKKGWSFKRVVPTIIQRIATNNTTNEKVIMIYFFGRNKTP